MEMLRDVGRRANGRASHGADAAPHALPVDAWSETLAEELREHLQRHIYGRLPQLPPATVLEKSPVHSDRLRDLALVERWLVELGAGADATRFCLFFILPRGPAPRAVILAQAIQRAPWGLTRIERALSSRDSGRVSLRDAALQLALGRHILTPPFEPIAKQGFALAVFCPGDLVPDHAQRAAPVLSRLSGGARESDRPGALSCWAALTSAVRRLLSEDPRLGRTPIVAWGHSRHGKAALLAAAFDPELAGVISHQSGRFGASLTHNGVGETPAWIARAYPHWFCPRFLDETVRHASPAVDQHHLLALIAPRPILLGNGRGDVWADPHGAFRAARAASAVFAQLGAPGLLQSHPDGVELDGGIAYFARDGGHGINAADWRNFLAFMDAKFGASRRRAGALASTAPADGLIGPRSSQVGSGA